MDNIPHPEGDSHNLMVRSLIMKNIFNWEFVLCVVIPIILFFAFSHFNRVFAGTIIVGLWSISVILIQFLSRKKVNLFAAIATGMSVIGLIGTIISRDPQFYLASPIVTDLILALVFLGSIVLGKPLLQIFAEYTVQGAFPEELRNTPKYKAAWTILTVAWGVLSISQALVRIILLYTVSFELYFSISTAYGNISTPLLLVISFWFPGWYWKREN